LQGKEAEIAESGKAQDGDNVPAVKVLVALNNLPAGTIVNPDLFRWQTWPEDGLAPEFIVQGSKNNKSGVKPADLTGWAVRRGIAAGEPINKKRLIEPGTAGFLAGVLGPGMRAVSTNINAETGAAGFIMPGDRVDVVLTQQVRKSKRKDIQSGSDRDKVISETVISDVRVLAIDQAFNDIQEQTRVGKTITMEVTPKQAESLAVAKRMGRVSLALRSLVRDPKIETKSAFTSDEEVSRFLRGRSSAVPRVLVARQNLPAGALLRDTDFTWQQLAPGDNGEDNIFEALESPVALRGSFLKGAVDGRKPILQSNIIRPGEQGFIVAALEPGMRAVSVAVDQVRGVSGFISPGDKVDLLLTHEVKDTTDKPVLTPRRFTETIVEDLRLLAVEQVVDPKSGKPKIGETITLEVTPQQAEIVALAASMGALSLSVRSVPAGEPDLDRIVSSDLGVSQALLDHVILGTKRDPDLVRRRSQLNRIRNAGGNSNRKKSARTPARGSSNRSVTIYRATAPSTVVIER
jgi:pilus assembly protein CpaB